MYVTQQSNDLLSLKLAEHASYLTVLDAPIVPCDRRDRNNYVFDEFYALEMLVLETVGEETDDFGDIKEGNLEFLEIDGVLNFLRSYPLED